MSDKAEIPETHVGQIVLYHSVAREHGPDVITPGRDMAAIVTGLTDEPGYVFLTIFAPPGSPTDLVNHQYGCPHGVGEGCWRPLP